MKSRRRIVPIALALSVVLGACGSDDNTSTTTDPGTTPAATDPASDPTGTQPADAGAFPVTIEHKYGSTTIDAIPERVISVGFTDQDTILALGVKPIAIRDWYGDQPFAVWPWAQAALGDSTPEVLASDALNFEQIAALEPDLILGLSSGMTEEEYTTLSAIAPTITQSGDYVDYGEPWDVATHTIGQALGKVELADTKVAEIKALFAAATAEHPEFVGAEGAVAYTYEAGKIGAYGPGDTRSGILLGLGFVLPPAIVEGAGDAFYYDFSAEEIDKLDNDLIVWVAADDATVERIKADPLRQGLKAAQEGREVFMNAELGGAAGFSSLLSLPYVLEQLVPQLAAAVDGDPATV